MIRSSRRRFVPSLDSLPSRLAPSGGTAAPVDPGLLGWTPPPPPPPPNPGVVCPVDPGLLGWTPPV